MSQYNSQSRSDTFFQSSDLFLDLKLRRYRYVISGVKAEQELLLDNVEQLKCNCGLVFGDGLVAVRSRVSY
jgi:hypothetical protein